MDILKVKRGGVWYPIPAIIGEKGDDGYSPSASVTKSGDTVTISITDKSGTTTQQVMDGEAAVEAAEASAQSAAQKATEAAASAGSAQTAATGAATARTAAEAAQSAAETAQTAAESAQTAAETAQSAAEAAAGAAGDSALDAYDAAVSAKSVMIIPATGGDAASVATVTDAANDQPMALKIGIKPVQDLHGYDNPWPAGGGKNKFTRNGETENSYVNISGIAATTQGWVLSDYIPVKGSTQYHFNPNSTEGDAAKLCCYNSQQQFVGYFNSGERTFTTQADCAYMRFSYRSTSTNIQLEEGTTATAYAPYSNICPISGWTGAVIRHSGSDTSDPNVYSIDFPTAAGTVYGGTLEIAQDGSGTLTVDTTYIELTGDYSWGGAGNTGYDGEVGTNRYIEFASNNLPVPLLIDSGLGQNGKAIRACDRLRMQLGPIWANDTNNNVINFNAQTQVHLRLANATIGVESTADGATRTAAFKAWLTANPVHVAYQIATPQTYALTVEQIKSLFGTNNVWADCGNTQITAYYADKTLLITAAEQRIENLTVSSETLPAGSQATVEKQETDSGINLAFGIPRGADGQSGGVTDVQVNGTSVVTNGVANVPIATTDNVGVVKINTRYGIAINSTGRLSTVNANSAQIKAGSDGTQIIAPMVQHESAFYGLAKAAGDTTQSASSNAVGNYTENAKSKISEMLSSPVTVTGTTPTITALSGIQYVCGEVSTLDITLPASGIVDVVFTSGSTPTVLTITPPTGMTVEWANGFDSTSLEADTLYELNVKMVGTKCLGVAGQWS